jgi:hypothetical protein
VKHSCEEEVSNILVSDVKIISPGILDTLYRRFIYCVILRANVIYESLKNKQILGFKGTEHLRAEITINSQMIEQVSSLNHLECTIPYLRKEILIVSYTNSSNY